VSGVLGNSIRCRPSNIGCHSKYRRDISQTFIPPHPQKKPSRRQESRIMRDALFSSSRRERSSSSAMSFSSGRTV
jgi:hypothetical protein